MTLEQLKRIIIRSLNLEGVTTDMIGDDDPLFGGDLGLDSVDALELIVALEKEFDVKIHAHELDPEVLASPSSIQRFIQSQVTGAESA